MITHRLVLLTVLLCLPIALFAKIWRVDSNPGNAADFRTLQAAHDGALDGDTLYVSGSPVNYGSVTITKKLIIIGPGYFLSENDSTQALPNAASAANITLDDLGTSDGSVMMGISCSNVYIKSDNVTIRRNYIAGTIYIGYTVAVTNTIIAQNYVYYIYLYHANNTSTIISNNIIHYYITATTDGSATIVNNAISVGSYSSTVLTCYNSFVQNNIIYYGGISGNNNTYEYNMDSNTGGGTPFPAGGTNSSEVDMGTVFVLTGSTDAKWKLKTASPALGAGTNGYDLSAFGGTSPYVLSGIPHIPAIYNVVAPVFGSGAQGLNVTVKAKSRN